MPDKIQILIPDETFYQKHVTFSSIPQIKLIIKQLGWLGITYFTFDRTYNDGAHIRLTSSGEWIEQYYRKELYNVAIFEHSPQVFTDGVIFWSWLNQDPIYTEASLFNISHGLTITKPHITYCDFYHFGCTNNNKISEDVLLSKIVNLYQFIAIFHQKCHKLILEAELNRFILPLTEKINFNRQELSAIISSENKSFQQDEIKRFYLGEEFDNNYLTGKELEILLHLKFGKKLVEIAKSLFVAEKTIESHINNIKDKLHCRTLFELGFIIHKLGIYRINNVNNGTKI